MSLSCPYHSDIARFAMFIVISQRSRSQTLLDTCLVSLLEPRLLLLTPEVTNAMMHIGPLARVSNG